MISVEEAQNLVNSQKPDWGTENIPLVSCSGRVLAEDIHADRDFPPFDRVTMDGIALSFDAFQKGQRRFEVIEVQLAGEPVKKLTDPTCALEIMTGAILATNCDLVIRYEDLKFSEQNGKKWVEIMSDDLTRWKNVHRQGSDQKKGDLLIVKGRQISSNMISIIATVGVANVLVRRHPKVAIIATGDELVAVDETPAPYQIRKSNTMTMEAELTKRSIPFESFHLKDDKKALTDSIKKIIDAFDIILLSGGVSKGKADFLPEVLESLGVTKLFHRVAQRPGKPFWFGVSVDDKPVFAFPGNPISTLMCFRVYFLEWLDQCLGIPVREKKAVLKEDFSFVPNLGYFLQVRSEISQTGEISVYPETGNGSGDLSNLSKSDAFLLLPAEQEHYQSGERYRYYSFTE